MASRSGCSSTWSRTPRSSSLFVHKGGRKFLIASHDGQGFVVGEDDCVGTTRKGKQMLNVEMPNEARALTVVGEGADSVAVIGDNRKMLIFPLDQVPEMARGRGVRLQKYKDGGLSDIVDLQRQGRADLARFRRPRVQRHDQGTGRMARQPRRRRPAAAEGISEVQQVRPRHRLIPTVTE